MWEAFIVHRRRLLPPPWIATRTSGSCDGPEQIPKGGHSRLLHESLMEGLENCERRVMFVLSIRVQQRDQVSFVFRLLWDAEEEQWKSYRKRLSSPPLLKGRLYHGGSRNGGSHNNEI